MSSSTPRVESPTRNAVVADPRPLPRQLLLGLALLAICWPLNRLLPGLRTHLLFFPLWLGYVLAVDGLVLLRTGDSPARRAPRDLAVLFLVSAPAWWIFEVFNWRLRNWEYLAREEFSDLEYFLLASIAFSTVMPAVFATSELVRSFAFVERFASGPRIAWTPRLGAGLLAAGIISLAAMLLLPRVFYPFLWVSLVLVLEPVCGWLGRGGLLADLERGDWRPWMSLWGGSLICGFFWEMWNVWSWPKWIYHVPGLGFAKVFEMPVLGYLGYLPFALELYLFQRLVRPRSPIPRLSAS